MTYIMIIIPAVFVYKYLVFSASLEAIYFFLLIATLLSCTAVALVDPGLVRRYHHARANTWTFCDHCESFRPPKSVHCSVCQVCIAGYDHHCPWTGKCVGIGNIIYFRIFMASLLLLFLYFLALLIIFLVRTYN
jgi:hypothetical protein